MRNKQVRLVLAAAFCLLLFRGEAAGQQSGTPRQPNIILILVDDLGYGDLTCHGRATMPKTIQTDRLAREGVRFTDAYASAPICSATRAGLLTGRYQQRFGYYGNFEFQVRLPASEGTLAQYLGEAGYTSALIGK